MKSIRATVFHGGIFIWLAITTAQAQTAQTNLAVTVRHAPSLNGGTIQGSVQQLNGENVTANGGLAMTGDLLVPGTPTLVLNGKPAFAGTIADSGGTSPSGYQVTLNGNCSLRYLRTRTTPVTLPAVPAPPAPTGTRNVTINSTGQSYGDAATLRDLTLNGNVGMTTVPPGTYGTFTVNGGSGLVLGVAGGLQAVNYNLQNLNLNGSSTLKIAGPVILTVANGFTANGTVGATNNPAWLQLQVASGGFTLNGGCTVYGLVLAPNGTVIVNGNSTLVGTSASDQFILNGGGLVRWGGLATQTNLPPVAAPQSITLAENSSTNITLTGSDSQGRMLTFMLLTLPTHGTASGTPPSVTYKPVANYFGSDAFTFKVNNGITDSSPATISLTVTQVYYPPTAFAQSLTNLEDTALSVTLTGSDPQGYALNFSVLTQPAHGTLSGTAPNLTYQPATNYFGNDSFTFRDGDGVSNSLPATISITNRPVDDPPIVVAGPNQLIILPANSVSLAGSVTYDVFPGTVDTVLWSLVSGPGDVTFGNPSNALTTATFSQSGIYRLRLFASDSFLSGSNDLFVTVDAPPVVSAGQTMTNTFPGTITLLGSASDDGLPANGTLKVVWSKISGPGTVIFSQPTTTNSQPVTTATFSTSGVYVLRLTADDGIATNYSDVTVIENLPPVVNAGTSILTNGLQAVLNGSVADDGLPGALLSSRWSQSTGPGTITFGNAAATNTTVTASQSGTYVLVLTASDGAATRSNQVAVTFNLPPVVNAGPAQTVNFGATVTLAGTVTDDQLPCNILTNVWTKASGPGNAVFAIASLTNTIVAFDQPGVYTLRLTASDTLATANADVVIRVNAAPVVNAGANQLVTLGPLVALAGSYTDDGIPGSTATTLWTQVSGPAGAVFTDPAAVSTTASFSQSGIYVLQLTVNDGLTNGSAQVTVTVDHAPAVTAISPILINWPANHVVLNGMVADDGLPAGGTLTSIWSQTSGPAPVNFSSPSLVNALNGAAIVTQPSTTATFTAPGLYELRLTGNDGQSANHADVTVTVNQTPTVNAGTNQIITWPASQVVLEGTAADDGLPAGSSLTTSWSKLSGSGTVAFANASSTNTTATFSTNGVYVLKLTVSDGVSTNSSDVSVIANTVPVVTISADTLMPHLPQSVALAGNVSDDGLPGNTLTYAWSQISGPGTVGFSNPNATNTTASFSQPGVYTLRLTANDSAAAGSGDISLTVLAVNQPPQAVGQSLVTDEDTALAITLNGTDPDGDALTFSVVTPPAHGTLGGTAPNLSYHPATNYNGTDSFTFTANDGRTNSAPATISLTINPVNDAPQLTVPAAQTVAAGVPLLFDTNRLISVADVDAGTGMLQLSLSVSNGVVILGNTNGLVWQTGGSGSGGLVAQGTLDDLNGALLTLSYVSSNGFSGEDALAVQINDLGNTGAGGNLADEKTVPIMVVQPANAIPVAAIASPAPNSIFEVGQPIPISVDASDADGLVSSVKIYADNNLLAELTDAPYDLLWTNAAQGVHVISAVATDDAGADSVKAAVSVSVLIQQSGDFTVNAGPDQIIELSQSAALNGVLDVQNPVDGASTNVSWTKASGPGDVQFSDNQSLTTTAQFSEPGTYILWLSVDYGTGTRTSTVNVDVLPLPPSRLTAARSSKGTDFWLTDLFLPAASSDGGVKLTILVAAETDTDVQIIKPGGILSFCSDCFIWLTNYVHVQAGTIATVPGMLQYGVWGDEISDMVFSNSVHVIASAPVTVYGFVRDTGSADGFLALPTALLSTNYMILSYPDGSEFALAATEDDTKITIVPTIDIADDRPAGQPWQLYLQRGQTYRVTQWEGDFTGTTIVSDKPIAVFGGTAQSYVPVNCYYADHLVEQMTPISIWGQHFATMPLATRLNGDTFRFLAAEDGTRVSLNGNVVANLNKGQFHEQIIDGPAIILSSHPILVGQYANGTTYDNVTGDPFMMLVPPVEQFGGNYLLDAVSLVGIRHWWEGPGWDPWGLDPSALGAEYSSYMNIIVYGNGTNAVSLDGGLVSPDQFQRIGDSGYFGAQLAVSNGNHSVSSPFPLGVCVYGWYDYESYAFTGGFYTDTVETGTYLTLTQATACAAVGSEKSVVAHVVNGFGNPIPDMEVSFSVAGANVAAGRVKTTRFGDAVFTWTGNSTGLDVVTATLVDLQQSVTNNWIVPADNTPPLVYTTNTATLQYGLTIHLSGNVYDNEQSVGNGLHLRWKLLSGPDDVLFDDASNVETLATCTLSGIYQFELSADDSQFGSRSVVTVRTDILPFLQFSMDETQLLIVGSGIQLTADAWDEDDVVNRVEFSANGLLIGIVTNDFYNDDNFSIPWTPMTNGWFQIQAIAYDSYGSVTSGVFNVQASYPPQVSIDSPDNGAVLTVPTNVLIHAIANDPDGTIASISIYVNGGLLGTFDGSNATTTWFPQREGDYVLTAIATDDLGLTTTSDNITVTVTGIFPQITITNPVQQGYAFTTPTGKPILVAADASIAAPYKITNVVIHIFPDEDISFSQPPYQIEWTPMEVGQFYDIVAEAYSDSGVIGTSADVTIRSQPDASVSIAEPTNGQTVFVGQPQRIRLALRDPWNILQGNGYDYSVNGQFLIEATNSEPVLWTPLAPGNYSIAFVGFPLRYSASVSVTAVEPPPIENLSIVSPNDGDSLYVGSPAPICLAFDDPIGIFDHAEFFANDVSLGQTTNSWLYWVPSETNDYILTATVFDLFGQAYDASNTVMVHVIPPPPPEIVILSPMDGDRLALGQETLVEVDVNDPAQAVTNIDLLVDGVKVTDSPDACISWTPSSIGSHQLTAAASDWNGNSVTSAPVNVAVVVMYPPTVTVTSPADGIHYTAETLPPLSATASDSDGIVTNLTLELDGVVLGTTNGTPLELPATNILGGWHSVLARATDNDGLTTASTAVSFFIERSEDSSLPVPAQLAAQAVSATEIQLTWLPLPTNTPDASVLVEKWSPDQSTWIEIGKASITETNYADPNLNPETSYRYRAATTDNQVHRSAYSAEAQATTRTVVPNYSVIDLTESLIASLTGHGPGANILTNSGLKHFDSRRTVPLDASHADSVLGTNATALKLAAARFKEQWPQIQLDYDPVLLSPKSVLPRLGYLSGPGGAGVTVSEATAQMFDPNDPHTPVKAFLQEYQTLFGFGPEALDDANVQRDYVSAGNGARTVVWQQQVAGVPVFNALLIGHITSAGELACLSSEFIPSPAQAADPAMVAAVQSDTDLPLSSPLAIVAAVTNIGDRFAAGYMVAESDATGVTRQQTFSAPDGIKGVARAELTWFPASRSQLKLCWQVLCTSQWRNEMYLTLVTADTGEILYRRNLTAESQEATYRVYTNASPAPLLPGLSAPGTTQPATVDRGLVTLTAMDDFASPNGWIADGDNETRGNNVDAHLDRNDDNLADLPRPAGNSSRVFDFPLDLTTAPANYGEAATVQLFYWDNWMHDALYQFGFTEAAGNFQSDNFGRGGLDDDALQADAQDGLGLNDGSHANNANMSTPPDGCAPRMQMYVFDGASPARDGALDAQIVLHEYTHGLSTRLIGGGAGIDALQSAGMGEGWSDFYALALLADPAADVDGAYPMGAYVTYHGFGSQFDQNYYYGIRRYPYCTDTNKNPLTFADIDPAKASAHDGVPRNPLLGPFRADQAGEVHSQGEVWCVMLWEMRASLIRKLGPEAGNNLALQLVTDGLKLSPPNPNFVQARDAILLAERMWSGGTNSAEIWSAFAKRGLGFNAKAPESYTTSGAQESHDLMPALAVEQVEIQGTNAVQLGADNSLLIHVRNQGDATATHVSGQLATAVPGVTVLQGLSAYSDIPQGGAGANAAVFQIQTGTGFVEGTPIDLAFAINSDQSAGTSYLRLFTGVPGAEILFDNYSAMADTIPASSGPKDLTPWDIANAEPLWMADDASCLLKLGTNQYVLWKPAGTNQIINNDKFKFLAHRLTRHGVVVGTVEDPVTRDEATNQVRHTWGAWWDFNSGTPQPLTTNEYHWPKNTAALDIAGAVFSLLNAPLGHPAFLTNVTTYPTLQDVWDLNASTQAVGSVSVQETFMTEQVTFASGGQMNWFAASERGLNAGVGTNSATQVNYEALFSTAAQFDSIENWRWLGPLSQYKSGVVAQLINDAGMIAGYGGVFTGDPNLDPLRPSHAFRALSTGEYDGSQPLLTDIGVLPGGAQSMPRAMNQAGEIVGYSDFDVTNTGGLNFSQYNSHAVFWGLTNEAPECLTNYPASSRAPHGYGDAFAINDEDQIVGASRTTSSQQVGVLWQLNHNTNGASSTTNAPFWEITDLNDRLMDPSWQVFNAVGINNDGLILAYARNRSGDNQSVLLIPMAMAVDANHDGQITFDNADQTTADNPYRFWVNDDQDTDAGDVIPVTSVDYGNDQIKSIRDLEDFARLNISVQGFADQIAQGKLLVGLKWKNTTDTTGYPTIKVWENLSPNGGIQYLTDTNVARQFLNLRHPGEVAWTETYLIPTNFWKDMRISATNSTGYLLFEGCSPGKGQLVLTINKPDGTEIAEAASVWLDLEEVSSMYEQAIITDNTTGAISDWTSTLTVKNPLPARPGEDQNIIVMVHGIHVSLLDWDVESDTVFKRLFWSGFQGKFVTVKWPCEIISIWTFLFTDTSFFNRSELKAYKAGSAMKTYVDQLHVRFPDYRLHLFVHSQGNPVVSTAVEQGATFDTYILTQGALPASAYDVNAPFDSGLLSEEALTHTPEWQPMGYRGIYTNMANMTGRIVNFFNPNDPVLRIWLADQGPGKPDGYFKHLMPGFYWMPYYTYDGSSGRYNGVTSYVVTDPQESRAMVSRSRTQPIGRLGPASGQTRQGVIESAVNLNERFGFDDAFPNDHSAQWAWPIQTSYLYYKQVLKSIQP